MGERPGAGGGRQDKHMGDFLAGFGCVSRGTAQKMPPQPPKNARGPENKWQESTVSFHQLGRSGMELKSLSLARTLTAGLNLKGLCNDFTEETITFQSSC